MFDLTTYEIVRKKYHAEGEWIVQWCTLYIKFILLFICEKIFYMRWLFTKFICKFRFCSLSPFCDTTETIRRDCVTRWIIFGRIIQLNPYLYVHWWFSKNLNTLLLWYFIVNFYLLLWNYLLILKVLPVTLSRSSEAAIWTNTSRIFQNRKPPRIYTIFVHFRGFFLHPMDVDTGGIWPITERKASKELMIRDFQHKNGGMLNTILWSLIFFCIYFRCIPTRVWQDKARDRQRGGWERLHGSSLLISLFQAVITSSSQFQSVPSHHNQFESVLISLGLYESVNCQKWFLLPEK